MPFVLVCPGDFHRFFCGIKDYGSGLYWPCRPGKSVKVATPTGSLEDRGRARQDSRGCRGGRERVSGKLRHPTAQFLHQRFASLLGPLDE